MKALAIIEVDVPDFADSSPEIEQTYRFCQPTDYFPTDIDAIPSITQISYSPSRISLGENLGERASLTVSFRDHRHIMDGESYDSGTFWGKWRARYGQRLRGRSLRWIHGLEGQALEDMETRHFIVESTDGPDPAGTYTIIAKDVLKLADNDRAQAPVLSSGFLVGNIDSDDTAITLNPSGIGNAEYPASGYVAIGGEEIVSFTRSGDAMTITRGQLGTVGVSHEAGDRVQLVLRYNGEDPADIIEDLLVNYAGVPQAYIPITNWQTETASFLQRLYTATIAEPVSVNTLVSELVEQAALAIWWEPLDQEVKLQVLRAIPTNAATFDEGNTLESSLKLKDQPGRRISQVWTYFGQRNPLDPIDEPDNFRSVAVTADLETEAAYGTPAIKKIFSRWIAFGGRQVALRLNDIQLARFRDPPRKINLDLFRYGPQIPVLGGGYRLESWAIQAMDGTPTDAPIQITRVNPMQDRYQIEAEEMLYSSEDQVDLANRVLIIDSNVTNINLRTLHDAVYPDPTVGDSPEINLTVYIEENVIVGSLSTSLPSLDVGTWPSGFPLTLVVRGRIQGMAGNGGVGGSRSSTTLINPTAGKAGGKALYTRHAIDLVLNEGEGEVWGGAGGGGGAGWKTSPGRGGGGGGGGCGFLPGNGGAGGDLSSTDGQPGNPGTTEAGGTGGQGAHNDPELRGGAGGGPGQNGSTGQPGHSGGASGGAAGSAIDGLSFVTKIGTGDIRGSQIN